MPLALIPTPKPGAMFGVKAAWVRTRASPESTARGSTGPDISGLVDNRLTDVEAPGWAVMRVGGRGKAGDPKTGKTGDTASAAIVREPVAKGPMGKATGRLAVLVLLAGSASKRSSDVWCWCGGLRWGCRISSPRSRPMPTNGSTSTECTFITSSSKSSSSAESWAYGLRLAFELGDGSGCGAGGAFRAFLSAARPAFGELGGGLLDLPCFVRFACFSSLSLSLSLSLSFLHGKVSELPLRWSSNALVFFSFSFFPSALG